MVALWNELSFPRPLIPSSYPPTLLPCSQLEQELYALPADFTNQLEQEVVLPGMVSTLSEVPLSAKDKLRSIEVTEALKRSLLAQVGGRYGTAADSFEWGGGARRVR